MSPMRLRIWENLRQCGDSNTFVGVMADLDIVHPGTLSDHVRALEDAGVVEVKKCFVRRRPQTTIAITANGRAEFERLASGLNKMAGTTS
ncbi:transcriptional regulator [Bradyrhizobium sp. 197]|nr:transcriptional regulator [Bradyrhizobium sp. 197]MCK1480472.1 transcriptional regulator [Bradyrhizobium sp. 197]